MDRSGAYAEYKGMLFFTEGECAREITDFDENEAYDPRTDTWHSFARLPIPLHGFGAATVGNNLYFIGGSTPCGGGIKMNNNLVFTLPE